MDRIFLLLILTLPLAAQGDPALLRIRIVEGDGAVYPIGSRATRGITVEVTDETGRPVDKTAVSFKLPDDGPTGSFPSGMRTEAVATGADGRASIWGMQWNRVPGLVEVRITAVKGQASAGAICGLSLTNQLVSSEPREASGPSVFSRHRKIWIAVAMAAGAFAGVAAATSRGTPAPAAAGTINAPQIGSPTIIIGKP